jgi:hypothetical protein
MKKKIQIGIAIVIAIFVITNPSLYRFQEFAPSQFNNYKYRIQEELKSSRVNNYFVLSIYEVSAISFRNSYYKETFRYYGVLGNFYFIDSKIIKLSRY